MAPYTMHLPIPNAKLRAPCPCHYPKKDIRCPPSPCPKASMQFPPSPFLPDIEDITSKTGNFKKFPVFCKMLLSAVKQAGRLGSVGQSI